jgi:hypothetical protein
MVIVSLLFGAGAVASLCGANYLSKRGQIIKDTVNSMKVFQEHDSTITADASDSVESPSLSLHIPHNERVIISHVLKIEIPWYELYEHVKVPKINHHSGLIFTNTTRGPEIQPSIVYSTTIQNRLDCVGSFLNMSVYSSLPFEPNCDVRYIRSVFDTLLSTKSGADISALIPLRRPQIPIKYDALYDLRQYTGRTTDPVFFMGYRSGNKFLFDKFSRDSRALLQDEIDDKTATTNLCKFSLLMTAGGCIMMGIISALDRH